MAVEIYVFDVTVPVGTAIAAPQVTDVAMPVRLVRQVDVRIPPGPRGEVGFAIGAAGVPVLPRKAGTWVVGDDETVSWPLERQIESGAWQVFLYNTGAYPHTIEFRFQVDLVDDGVPAPTPPGIVAAHAEVAAAAGVVTPTLTPSQGFQAPVVTAPTLGNSP